MGYKFIYRRYEKGFRHIFMLHAVNGVLDFSEISEWCIEQFGDDYTSGASNETARWYMTEATAIVGFRRDKDAFAFKMRWWG